MFRASLICTILLSWPVYSQSTIVDEKYQRYVFQALSQDPELEVTQTQTGIDVKKKTDKSEDPEDPEETKKLRNDQMVVSFEFGLGRRSQNRNGFRKVFGERGAEIDNGTKYEGESPIISGGIGVRPSPQFLKRLFLQVSAGLVDDTTVNLSPTKPNETRYLGGSGSGVDIIGSAEWDVFQRDALTFSAGAYHMRFPVAEMSIVDGPGVHTEERTSSGTDYWIASMLATKLA